MSITEEQAKAAIKAYWQAQMDPLIPVKFENEAFVEPSPPVLWCAVELRTTDRVQETLGSPGQREYRTDAAVWVHVMGVNGQGTGAQDALITTLRAKWEGVDVSEIKPAGGARTVPVGGDGLWYEVVLIQPVQYTERK